MKGIVKIFILSIVVIITIITFCNQYKNLISDIENTAKEKEAYVNRYIDFSKGFMDLVTLYGNDFFKHSAIKDSDLYSLLHYNPETNLYNLDSIGGTKYQKDNGNLTGLGAIPDRGTARDEVNLALELNEQFRSIYGKLPDITWLYYTSNNKFINIYPWVSSDEFTYRDDLLSEKFYICVTPENNPLRDSQWSPVYLDQAGKGLMVTLSSPIYDGDLFLGVVSLDLTNNQLSKMISSNYEIYIIDDSDVVIANSSSKTSNSEIITLKNMLGSTQEKIDNLKALQRDSFHIVGGYLIYPSVINNAPWRIITRVPLWYIIVKSALLTLPITAILLILMFMFFEVDKRKKAEVQLKHSLAELTSYQTLLENAAKYDFLTSTVNRRGLSDIFNKNIKPADCAMPPVFLIMGDIDNFKKFNDTYGHAAGDKVLMEIAKIIQKNVNRNDIVCRWGGEEFVILIVGGSYSDALNIAEKVRKEIESASIPWENSAQLKATMTFGIVQHDYSGSLESSICKADCALYIGKQSGKNIVVDYRDHKTDSPYHLDLILE